MNLDKFKEYLDNLQLFDSCRVVFMDENNKEIELVYVAIDQLEANKPEVLLKFKKKD